MVTFANRAERFAEKKMQFPSQDVGKTVPKREVKIAFINAQKEIM